MNAKDSQRRGAGWLTWLVFLMTAVLLAGCGSTTVPTSLAITASPPPGATPMAAATPSSPGITNPASTPSESPAVGPGPGSALASFVPFSLTFVSPSEGWLLGLAACSGSPCAAIVRTTDGGRTWRRIPAPDASIAARLSSIGDVPSGIGGLRFADPLDGWAFGPELWATHDGGTTWSKVAIPGLAPGFKVMALETAGGRVHAAIWDDAGYTGLRIGTSPTDHDAWSLSPVTVDFGAGPVPRVQIVLHGTAGWLVVVNRVVVSGARLVADAWQAWRPPCADVVGPARLAASTEDDLVAACDVGLWGGTRGRGVRLFSSTDAGASFAPVAGEIPVHSVVGIAAPDPSVALVAGEDVGSSEVGSALVATFDGGRSWSRAFSPGLADLRFTTISEGVGFIVGGGGGGPVTGSLVKTSDGGHSWSIVPIAVR